MSKLKVKNVKVIVAIKVVEEEAADKEDAVTSEADEDMAKVRRDKTQK